MATKRKTSTRRRPRQTKAMKEVERLKIQNARLRGQMSSKPKRKTKRRSRRRSMSQGGILGIANPAMRGGLNASINGLVGGALGIVFDGMFADDLKPVPRIGAKALMSLIAGAGMKKPYIGAGIAGQLANDLQNELGMSEGMKEVNYVEMDSLPPYLNENGYALEENIYPYQDSIAVPYGG